MLKVLIIKEKFMGEYHSYFERTIAYIVHDRGLTEIEDLTHRELKKLIESFHCYLNKLIKIEHCKQYGDIL